MTLGASFDGLRMTLGGAIEITRVLRRSFDGLRMTLGGLLPLGGFNGMGRC